MLLEVANCAKIILFHKELQRDKEEHLLHPNNWNVSSLLQLIFILKKLNFKEKKNLSVSYFSHTALPRTMTNSTVNLLLLT